MVGIVTCCCCGNARADGCIAIDEAAGIPDMSFCGGFIDGDVDWLIFQMKRLIREKSLKPRATSKHPSEQTYWCENSF